MTKKLIDDIDMVNDEGYDDVTFTVKKLPFKHKVDLSIAGS